MIVYKLYDCGILFKMGQTHKSWKCSDIEYVNFIDPVFDFKLVLYLAINLLSSN